jgi:5-methylcytosine-specific restriction endonuclease McrA
VIFELIAEGSITVTSVRLLSGSLTEENHRELLGAAVHKTKREVETLVAALRPQPPVPSIVRKLPSPKPVLIPASQPDCTEAVTPAARVVSSEMICEPPLAPVQPHRRAAVVAPLAPERYKIQMTVSRETHDKLRRVQDLMRHQLPDGDVAAVFDRALTLLLQDLERKKLAHTNRPRPARTATPGSRHVPAAVRREVWKRDGGQCAFIGNEGRCSERGFLEFHHEVPFADGGPASVANIQLRCRSHNAYQAEERFGPLVVREARAEYNSFQDRVQCWQGISGARPPT